MLLQNTSSAACIIRSSNMHAPEHVRIQTHTLCIIDVLYTLTAAALGLHFRPLLLALLEALCGGFTSTVTDPAVSATVSTAAAIRSAALAALQRLLIGSWALVTRHSGKLLTSLLRGCSAARAQRLLAETFVDETLAAAGVTATADTDVDSDDELQSDEVAESQLQLQLLQQQLQQWQALEDSCVRVGALVVVLCSTASSTTGSGGTSSISTSTNSSSNSNSAVTVLREVARHIPGAAADCERMLALAAAASGIDYTNTDACSSSSGSGNSANSASSATTTATTAVQCKG
jgi:hypothetical protein